MLSRLIVILVQLAVGWYGGRELLVYLPDMQKLNIFLAAVVFAIVVWLVGLVAGAVLKDVARPSPQTLIFSMAVAVIFSVITLLPDVEGAIKSVVQGDIPHLVYPLVGAVVGYAIQR